jgi:hypothetical protein
MSIGTTNHKIKIPPRPKENFYLASSISSDAKIYPTYMLFRVQIESINEK